MVPEKIQSKWHLEFLSSYSPMEKLRKMVNQIAYTPPPERFSSLSPLQLSLIPLLSFASHLYRVALFVRHRFYQLGFFPRRRMPVPVISVGNLTWGGNGKTPMVEFIARWLADSGISPLILTRGYGGADEAKMLQRQLIRTSAKIGVGANRAGIGAVLLEKYGYIDFRSNKSPASPFSDRKARSDPFSDKIGAVILDDGMQHLSLCRDLEIMMVNGLMPWGNYRLVPLGPLREPLSALSRIDMVVIHHADLVTEQSIEAIRSTVQDVKDSVPIFLSKMAPLYFLKATNVSCKVSLRILHDAIALCVSGIGSAESFVQTIIQMGPKHVDRVDFSDHHAFQTQDISAIKQKLKELELEFAMKPLVVVTEKDYDRAPEVLRSFDPYEVLVLCSCLQILHQEGHTEASFKHWVRQRLNLHL